MRCDFLLPFIIQNDYGQGMEDNSGKKFSLQDWVMKRAANQSGVVHSSRAMSHTMRQAEELNNHSSVQEERTVEVEMKSVSNGATLSTPSKQAMAAHSELEDMAEDIVSEIAKEVAKEVARVRSLPDEILLKKHLAESLASDESDEDDDNDRETGLDVHAFSMVEKEPVAPKSTPVPIVKEIKPQVSVAPAQNPAQQMQIVKLLTDMGDRLRQTEKEREVLWKEVEFFRKQISDMSGTTHKSEKSYANLETQINQREVFVQELVERQATLEKLVESQKAEIEASKADRSKLQEKLESIETATGSAIVRVEDVMAENAKLSKRVEQLGQDKARLVRKLEVVEETLTQTQDILKAKALVLLTDQAVARQSALPQTPAWTGDDTLKVSQPKNEQAFTAQNPVGDIAKSLRAQRQVKTDIIKLAVATALVSLAIALAGYWAFIQFNTKKETVAPIDKVSEAIKEDKPMADIAKMANDIEPEALTDGDKVVAENQPDESVLDSQTTPNEVTPTETVEGLNAAMNAQDKAYRDFFNDAPTKPVNERLRADRTLPKAVQVIEGKALRGDVVAQHDLGAIYTAGHAGAKINYTKAAQWFEEASYGGSSNAQYNLGVLYHQGLGAEKSLAKAIQMYRVAAHKKHPEALYNLAIAYAEGVGVEYNPQIAAVYFERAAEQGVVEAAYNLGLLQENGLLGESQPDEAVFWFTLAANKGNEDASVALKKLKSQLSMTDKEAERVVLKIATEKGIFLNSKGQVSLPDETDTSPKSTEVKKEVVGEAVTNDGDADPVVISQIQEQLSKLDLYDGLPDGTNSATLQKAIKSYQQKYRLKVDGQASDDLLVQMLAANTEIRAQ